MTTLVDQSLATVSQPILGLLPLPPGMAEYIIRIITSPGGFMDVSGALMGLMTW